MYPILLEFGSALIPSWHVAFFVGATLALLFFVNIGPRIYPDLSSHALSRVFFFAYLGGYIGARAFSVVVEEQPASLMDLVTSLFSIGAMTFFGGGIGAFVFGYAAVRKLRLPVQKTLDLGITAGLIGLAVGRIGCFLNGDDYGKGVPFESQSSWWAVTFPALHDNVPRYPVQLVESLFAIFLACLLVFCTKKLRTPSGYAGILGIFFYSVFRLFIEFYRGDDRGWVVQDLISPSQLVSMVLIAICIPPLRRHTRDYMHNLHR